MKIDTFRVICAAWSSRRAVAALNVRLSRLVRAVHTLQSSNFQSENDVIAQRFSHTLWDNLEVASHPSP